MVEKASLASVRHSWHKTLRTHLFLNNLDLSKTKTQDIFYQMFSSKKKKSRLWFSVKYCASSCPADTLRGLSGAWPWEEDWLLLLQGHHFSKHISQPWGATCPANQILLWNNEDFCTTQHVDPLHTEPAGLCFKLYLSNLRHVLLGRTSGVFIEVTN